MCNQRGINISTVDKKLNIHNTQMKMDRNGNKKKMCAVLFIFLSGFAGS